MEVMALDSSCMFVCYRQFMLYSFRFNTVCLLGLDIFKRDICQTNNLHKCSTNLRSFARFWGSYLYLLIGIIADFNLIWRCSHCKKCWLTVDWCVVLVPSKQFVTYSQGTYISMRFRNHNRDSSIYKKCLARWHSWRVKQWTRLFYVHWCFNDRFSMRIALWVI